MSDNPIEISYETICPLDRSPPNSAYLLLDDQPASTMPYTPSEVIASTNRKPMGRSAKTMSMRPHFDAHEAPKGITAQASIAGVKDSIGARKKSALFTYGGSVSSFM